MLPTAWGSALRREARHTSPTSGKAIVVRMQRAQVCLAAGILAGCLLAVVVIIRLGHPSPPTSSMVPVASRSSYERLRLRDQYFPPCSELYTRELFDDAYYTQARKTAPTTAADGRQWYQTQVYEPALDVRVARARIWRGDQELATATSTDEAAQVLATLVSQMPPVHQGEDVWHWKAADGAFAQSFPEAVDKLMIVAHPDDETLFGFVDLWEAQEEQQAWVAAQDETSSTGALPPLGWKVIVLTNGNSVLRTAEFMRAMSALQVHHYEVWSQLDSMNANGRLDERLVRKLSRAMYERPWQKIVTHDLRGEYGHEQHRAIARVVHSLVFNPMAEAWPRNDHGQAPEHVQSHIQGEIDGWRAHYHRQSQPSASSSANSTDPSTTTFPFESVFFVFASMRDQLEAEYRHHREAALARGDRLAIPDNPASSSSPGVEAGSPRVASSPVHQSISNHYVEPLTRAATGDARTREEIWEHMWTDPPPLPLSGDLPPSLSLESYQRKLDVLQRHYPSQWSNLAAQHHLDIQFADASLRADRRYQEFCLQKLMREEMMRARRDDSTREFSHRSTDRAPMADPYDRWKAWQERAEAAHSMWDWKQWSCRATDNAATPPAPARP